MAGPGLDPSQRQTEDGSWCLLALLQVGLIFHHSLNDIKAGKSQQRCEPVIKAPQTRRGRTAFPQEAWRPQDACPGRASSPALRSALLSSSTRAQGHGQGGAKIPSVLFQYSVKTADFEVSD